MKKLSKIRLHNAIVMNDREMKSVTGGFVTGGEDSGSDIGGCSDEQCSDDCYITGTLIKGTCTWINVTVNDVVVLRKCGCVS